MDDPKIFQKFFFAFLESTFFNSRKNAIKNFSADFPLYDGLGLRKNFKHFWLFFLWHFLANDLKYFDETWSKVRQSGYKADEKDKRPSDQAILSIFSLKVGKNRPKSAKIYG